MAGRFPLFVLTTLVQLQHASAAVMVGGNVIVLRLDSTSTLSAAAARISILEIDPSGSTVQTISVPSTGTYACTLAGTTAIAGKLTMGAAGLYSSFACINAAVGTSSVSSTSNVRGCVFIYADGTQTQMTQLNVYTSPAREVYSSMAYDSTTTYYMVCALH